MNKNSKANNANNNINLNNQFMKKYDNIYINNTNDKNNNNISIKSNSNNKIIKNNINNMNNLIDKNNFNNMNNLNNFNTKNNFNNINNKNNINYVNIPNNMNNVNNAFNNNYVNNTNNNTFMINTNNMNYVNNTNNNNYVNNTNNMNYMNNADNNNFMINTNNMNSINNINNKNNVNNMNNNMNYANNINNNMNNFKNMYYLNNINNNGNKNNIQKTNQFYEIFKKANAQFTEMNMKKNKSSNNLLQSQEDLEEKITIIFKFLTDHQEKVKARLDELFYNVFKRFHETQCPPDLKHYMCYAYHNNKLIDNQKTLNENGIKNGDTILFNRIDENYKEEEEEVEEDNEEDEEEKNTLLRLWIKEYGCIVKNNLLLSNNEEKNILNSTIRDYINKKFLELGIKTKEHEHKLIYCKTNFNWICSECPFVDTKQEPRLFCSICNYNMCNNCRKNKKYYKIGNIPLSALPSNKKIKNYAINYSEHEHRLVYCRTKRTSHNIVGWICNKCKGKYTEKEWTFYCTKCDYDLCFNCAQNNNIF